MIKWPKFEPGDCVKVIKVLDNFTSKKVIGKQGIVLFEDWLPNGDYNYELDIGYFHEEELAADEPRNALRRLTE